MSASTLEIHAVRCPACKVVFRNIGTYMNHGKVSKTCTAEDRFWARVTKKRGCWSWTGCKDKWGYGDISFKGKHIQAHRLAWRLLRGEPGNLDVLHRCNNPECCNPKHLYLGTDRENARDRVAAGNHVHGEKAYNAKLNADDVREIRRLKGKVSGYKLAKRYGVVQSYISQIQSGRTWKHIL